MYVQFFYVSHTLLILFSRCMSTLHYRIFKHNDEILKSATKRSVGIFFKNDIYLKHIPIGRFSLIGDGDILHCNVFIQPTSYCYTGVLVKTIFYSYFLILRNFLMKIH